MIKRYWQNRTKFQRECHVMFPIMLGGVFFAPALWQQHVFAACVGVTIFMLWEGV